MANEWMDQKYTSASTSINSGKVPALIKKLRWDMLEPGSRNLDWGGGRYDTATEYLKTFGIKNVIYDPFNRSPEENQEALDVEKYGLYDTITISNVLNVIAEKEIRYATVRNALDYLKPGGGLYISVYEGNRSGQGRETKPGCWQCNMKLADYADELKPLMPFLLPGLIMILKED